MFVSRGRIWRASGHGPSAIGGDPDVGRRNLWYAGANETPLALVRAAILAANGHNAQPWLFKVSDSRIELYADSGRTMGPIDPYLRDMHLSLGCALENLVVAAAPNGYATSVTLTPGTLELVSNAAAPPQRVAVVELAPTTRSTSELYQAIPDRHTNRALYDPARPLPPEFIHALHDLSRDDDVRIVLVTGDHDRQRVVDATMASAPIFRDSAVARGNNRWARASEDEMDKAKDGFLALPDPTTKGVPHATIMLSAPLFGLIVVRDRYERAQALRAGRLWQRAHLLATARGIAARPDNAGIELIDYQRRLKLQPDAAAHLAELAGDPMWQPTMVFYMGYASAAAIPSPRRPISDVLLSADRAGSPGPGVRSS
jgi:nitroreductase